MATQNFDLQDPPEQFDLQDPPSFDLQDPPEVKVKPRSFMDIAKDVGISLTQGVIQINDAAAGLIDLVTPKGYGSNLIGYDPKDTKAMSEKLDTKLSPAQQAANKKVQQAKGFTEQAKTAITNPSTIFHEAVKSVPSMVAGGIVGRGLMLFKSMLALGETAPLVASAIGEGVVQTGSAAEQSKAESPTGDLGYKQRAAAITSGATDSLISLLGGKVAKRLGITDIDVLVTGKNTSSTPRKKIYKRVLEGMASEGILEELPQSTQEQIWQNYADDKPLMEGVDSAAVMGMFAGMAMGGAGNIPGGGDTKTGGGKNLKTWLQSGLNDHNTDLESLKNISEIVNHPASPLSDKDRVELLRLTNKKMREKLNIGPNEDIVKFIEPKPAESTPPPVEPPPVEPPPVEPPPVEPVPVAPPPVVSERELLEGPQDIKSFKLITAADLTEIKNPTFTSYTDARKALRAALSGRRATNNELRFFIDSRVTEDGKKIYIADVESIKDPEIRKTIKLYGQAPITETQPLPDTTRLTDEELAKVEEERRQYHRKTIAEEAGEKLPPEVSEAKPVPVLESDAVQVGPTPKPQSIDTVEWAKQNAPDLVKAAEEKVRLKNEQTRPRLITTDYKTNRDTQRSFEGQIVDWLTGKSSDIPKPTALYRGVPKGSTLEIGKDTGYVHGTPWITSAHKAGKGAFGDVSSNDVYEYPISDDVVFYRGGALAGDPLESTRIKNTQGKTWSQLMEDAKKLYLKVLNKEARNRGDMPLEDVKRYAANSVIDDLMKASFETDINKKPGIWTGQKTNAQLDRETPLLRSYDDLRRIVAIRRKHGVPDEQIPEIKILERAGKDIVEQPTVTGKQMDMLERFYGKSIDEISDIEVTAWLNGTAKPVRRTPPKKTVEPTIEETEKELGDFKPDKFRIHNDAPRSLAHLSADELIAKLKEKVAFQKQDVIETADEMVPDEVVTPEPVATTPETPAEKPAKEATSPFRSEKEGTARRTQVYDRSKTIATDISQLLTQDPGEYKDPQVTVQKYINDVNRWLDGEDIDIDQVRKQLADISKNSGKFAYAFEDPDEPGWRDTFNEWQVMVKAASEWADTAKSDIILMRSGGPSTEEIKRVVKKIYQGVKAKFQGKVSGKLIKENLIKNNAMMWTKLDPNHVIADDKYYTDQEVVDILEDANYGKPGKLSKFYAGGPSVDEVFENARKLVDNVIDRGAEPSGDIIKSEVPTENLDVISRTGNVPTTSEEVESGTPATGEEARNTEEGMADPNNAFADHPTWEQRVERVRQEHRARQKSRLMKYLEDWKPKEGEVDLPGEGENAILLWRSPLNVLRRLGGDYAKVAEIINEAKIAKHAKQLKGHFFGMQHFDDLANEIAKQHKIKRGTPEDQMVRDLLDEAYTGLTPEKLRADKSREGDKEAAIAAFQRYRDEIFEPIIQHIRNNKELVSIIGKKGYIRGYFPHFMKEMEQQYGKVNAVKMMHTLLPEKFVSKFLHERESNQWASDVSIYDVIPSYIASTAKTIHDIPAYEKARQLVEKLPGGQYTWAGEDTKKYAKWFIQNYMGIKSDILGFLDPDKLLMRMSSKVAKIYYHNLIGLNYKTWMVNMFQTVINTIPEIGMANAARGAYKLITDKEARQKFHDSGLLMDFPGMEIGMQAHTRIPRILHVGMAATEYLNRGISYLGGLEKAKQMGLVDKAAELYANEVVNNTQFAYGPEGQSQLLASLPPDFRVFQTFRSKELEFFRNLLHDAAVELKTEKRRGEATAKLERFLIINGVLASALMAAGIDVGRTFVSLWDMVPWVSIRTMDLIVKATKWAQAAGRGLMSEMFPKKALGYPKGTRLVKPENIPLDVVTGLYETLFPGANAAKNLARDTGMVKGK